MLDLPGDLGGESDLSGLSLMDAVEINHERAAAQIQACENTRFMTYTKGTKANV